MSYPWSVNDPYFRKLVTQEQGRIEGLLGRWNLATAFVDRIDRWFANFPAEYKALAQKILLSIDYYSPERFDARLIELRDNVYRIIIDRGFDEHSLVLVTPRGGGDSAHRHAYDVGKAWGLPQDQIKSISELDAYNLAERFLVLFNDTYGSGDQFMEMLWPRLKDFAPNARAIIVVGIAVSGQAYRKLKELPQVIVVPDLPTMGVPDVFTHDELSTLKDLGSRVYSKHPLGFGGTALLTAYYFQCPNNTLPVVWADGTNNSIDGKRGYPWSPLFPYRPKVKNHITMIVEGPGDSDPTEREQLLREIADLRSGD